jgi:predicted DNA-binding ribbon-helix-helix protein
MLRAAHISCVEVPVAFAQAVTGSRQEVGQRHCIGLGRRMEADKGIVESRPAFRLVSQQPAIERGKPGSNRMKSPVAKRSIVIGGHKTSVSLEEAFWSGLKEIAGRRSITLSDLASEINRTRNQGNLSSAIRLQVLAHYRDQMPPSEARKSDSSAMLGRL